MQHPKSLFEIRLVYGPEPSANQRVRPQSKSIHKKDILPNIDDESSDQTQVMGVIPQSIQFIDQRMRQTFQNRSFSEGNVPSNMPGNNDEEEFDESNPNRPPPLLTSSSEPIFRTIEGNVIKHDNSSHITNISSYNAKDNEIENSFNYNYSSQQSLCFSFVSFLKCRDN